MLPINCMPSPWQDPPNHSCYNIIPSSSDWVIEARKKYNNSRNNGPNNNTQPPTGRNDIISCSNSGGSFNFASPWKIPIDCGIQGPYGVVTNVCLFVSLHNNGPTNPAMAFTNSSLRAVQLSIDPFLSLRRHYIRTDWWIVVVADVRFALCMCLCMLSSLRRMDINRVCMVPHAARSWSA